MAVLETGEATIQAKGKTYRLVVKTAGLMAFQKHFSTPEKVADLDVLLGKVNDGAIEYIVAFIWAALRKYHPEVTLEGTYELIDDVGGVPGLGQQLMALGESTVPEKADVDELERGSKKNPRKARAKHGTGGDSTSTLAQSA